MVLAFHLPLANYGFWLPNDGRGSGSDFVRNKNLLPYGLATKVTTRRSVARAPHDFEVRRLAKEALKYPAVEFNGKQALSCGKGIANAIVKHGIVVWACTILPGHMHLVVKRHSYAIEQVVRQVRTAMTKQLREDGLHPLAEYRAKDGSLPTLWGASPWKVFLFDEEDIRRSIDYVRDNPLKERKPIQSWNFVRSFRGIQEEFGVR